MLFDGILSFFLYGMCMVNTDMSLFWFRFPSEAEPETRISLQVALGQIKR